MGDQTAAKQPVTSQEAARLVFEALGAASMCWETLRTAEEFQSNQAAKIGRELLKALGFEVPDGYRDRVVAPARGLEALEVGKEALFVGSDGVRRQVMVSTPPEVDEHGAITFGAQMFGVVSPAAAEAWLSGESGQTP